MAAIDIGSGCANRSSYNDAGYTIVDKGNPANDTGKLTVFKTWFFTSATSGVKIGTVYGTSPKYTSRDYELIGAVTAGSEQTFSGLDCDVQTNDLVACYNSNGTIEYAATGGSGIGYYPGDRFGQGQTSYTIVSTGLTSLYGTGSTGEIELAGTIAAQSALTGELTGGAIQTEIYASSAKNIQSADTSYTAARDAAYAGIYSSYLYVGQRMVDSPAYRIHRGFPYFDTSVIPVGAIIKSAVLSVWPISKYTTQAFDIVIQNGQPTYPSEPLVETDYNRTYYSGNGGSIAAGDLVLDQYNDITITELGWITPGSTTKFCLRSSRDIDGNAPTADGERVIFTTEVTYKTKLTVTYVPGVPLAGTIAAQSALQGVFEVARKITGALAAQTGITGALEVSRELTGAIASQSSIQAALALSRKITGTVAGQSLVQGILTLGAIEALTGTIAVQSDVSGNLTLGAEEVLAGVIAAQSGISGQLSRIMKLAGVIAAQSGVAGVLGTAEIYLAGIIAADATVEGGLSGIWRITGETAGMAGMAGVLTVPGPGQRQAGMFLVV